MKKVSLGILLIWMVVIFLFSGETATDSTKTSKTFTYKVITVVEKITKTEIKEDTKNKIIDETFKMVRKFAHFLEYFLLAIFLMVVLKNYGKMDLKLVFIVILIGLLYAITDELHQLFVPGRTGKVFDILIDFLGISLGSFSYYFICKRDRKTITRKLDNKENSSIK